MSSAGCKKSNGASSSTACSGCRRMIRLLVGKGAGLVQDGIGDTNLADVVGQGAATDMDHVSLVDAEGPCQVEHRRGDLVAVGDRRAIAEFHRARPALDDVIIGRRESTGILLGWDETTTGRRCIGGDGARE